MRVLFDGIAAQKSPTAKFHGGGEYAIYIFASAVKAGYRPSVVFRAGSEVPPEMDALISEHKLDTVTVAGKQQLYRQIDSGLYDRFYSALPYDYYDYPCATPITCVIHGLRNIEVPYTLQRARMEPCLRRRLAIAAAAVLPFVGAMMRRRHWRRIERIISLPGSSFITVSETTKAAMRHVFPDLKGHIDVAYSPFHSGALEPAEKPGDYYLIVSANRFEKNVPLAIKAFDSLFDKGVLPGRRVVVTGCEAGAFYTRVRHPERFEFLPYVSREKLEELLRGAWGMVYPSMNEGFGYPPLKAMAYGVPVIASAATSMPEACGNAALFFPPESAHELCTRIMMLEGDASLRARLSAAGRRRVAEVHAAIDASLERVLRSIFE